MLGSSAAKIRQAVRLFTARNFSTLNSKLVAQRQRSAAAAHALSQRHTALNEPTQAFADEKRSRDIREQRTRNRKLGPHQQPCQKECPQHHSDLPDLNTNVEP